jgi:hypothetical protein
MNFEERWKEFLARSSNPYLYSEADKNLVCLGFTWGQMQCIDLLQSNLNGELSHASASAQTKG